MSITVLMLSAKMDHEVFYELTYQTRINVGAFRGYVGGEDSSVMIGSEITIWEILKEGYYRSTEKRSRK